LNLLHTTNKSECFLTFDGYDDASAIPLENTAYLYLVTKKILRVSDEVAIH